MSKRQHLTAILILPFTVNVIIPALLFLLSVWIGWSWLLLYPVTWITFLVGSVPIILGLFTLYKTNRAFARAGKGTLAPWAPTQRLVVVGLYQYVRNPMILGVLFVLLGEAIFLGSLFIFFWFALFWAMNHIWFIRWEEPDLEQRFGDEYRTYKVNVPRWIPRRYPWHQNSTPGE